MTMMDRMDIIDIYRGFHPRTSDYACSSTAHGTFSRTDHLLGHKTSLNTIKKTEIIPSIFSGHSALQLEINC